MAIYLTGWKNQSLNFNSHIFDLEEKKNDESSYSTELSFTSSSSKMNRTMNESRSLSRYIRSMQLKGSFSKEIMYMMVELSRRFLVKTRGKTNKNICIFKIVSTALFVSQKFVYDVGYFNLKQFSLICGNSSDNLLEFEEFFCETVEYDLYVSRLDIEMTKLLIKGRVHQPN